MSFSRAELLKPQPDHTTLTKSMIGIGMNFADEGDFQADIEETLLQASIVGMDGDDLRVLSVLTTWLGIHHKHINVDRLIRGTQELQSERCKAYWSAIAIWLKKDRRYLRLTNIYEGAQLELLEVGTSFQVSRRGEDERFKDTPLLVPAGTLRDRAVDVRSQSILAQKHAGYRNRILMGPSWRADVWTVLESEQNLSTAELARRVGCSFATAWQVAQDFKLLYPEQDRREYDNPNSQVHDVGV
jgi:hypothetical protein